MNEAEPLSAHFTTLDWVVVLGYLALTTWLGAKLAGKQATIRDFFLGGRKLPWYAVAGSIVATELSAVTFVAVPALVFAPGGDLTYLQLGLFGSLLARLVVAWWLVPAYYEREIYSPYDYMGARLGRGMRGTTTVLFSIGGILAQASRVYLTAVVFDLLLGDALFTPLAEATGIGENAWAIWTIGIIAVAWTLLGGITTVIWTDLILFFVFVIGALVALAVVVSRLDGGFGEVLDVAAAAGKLRFLDADPDPTKSFTLWTAIFANTWFGVAMYGTDQMMAQRVFCCRGVREARVAVVASFIGVGVAVLMCLVGLGLFAFDREHPLTGAALAEYQADHKTIFPIFIIEQIRPGLTGLCIAGIFAAAISSLDSILAALSQTTLSALVQPWRGRVRARRGEPLEQPGDDRNDVRTGRWLVVGFGVLLCVVAQVMEVAEKAFPSFLDLALAMATYAAGALLAGFVLAFVRPAGRAVGVGFAFAGPLSVLCVFAANWAGRGFAEIACWIGAALLALAWGVHAARAFGSGRATAGPLLARSLLLLTGCALPILIQRHLLFANEGAEGFSPLAWPWYPMIGSAVAFAFALGLALPEREPARA